MTLDFSNCKSPEDVQKVFVENKELKTVDDPILEQERARAAGRRSARQAKKFKPVCFDPLCEMHNPKRPGKLRQFWMLPPDDLHKHWTVIDREPTSVGWIHVQEVPDNG